MICKDITLHFPYKSKPITLLPHLIGCPPPNDKTSNDMVIYCSCISNHHKTTLRDETK